MSIELYTYEKMFCKFKSSGNDEDVDGSVSDKVVILLLSE